MVTSSHIFNITPQITVGKGHLPVIMAGPCVAESLEICKEIAGAAQEACAKVGLPYIFKASFDKANRTSISAFRGPGLQEGLEILAKIKKEFNVPIITDVHEPEQCAAAAQVADVLQIPAFLCRQTDLLVAAGNTGKTINVKKGQFLAPEDMQAVIKKLESTGNDKLMLTERGASFGYHNLVVDMRSLVIMGETGYPVVFDATHAVQLPGGQGNCSGGNREYVFPLARAAAAVGIQGLFLETHPRPEKALSDGANSLPLDQLATLLKTIRKIHETCC